MDHWGDPWSDSANDVSVTKTEVTSPLPSAHPSAPVLLNGILDDAGWGSEDSTFGDWATAPDSTAPATRTPHTFTDDIDISGGQDASQDGKQWGMEEHSKSVLPIEGHDWHQDRLAEAGIDSVPSEASDSATTVQQNDCPDDMTIESSGQPQPDDNSSARPSTSLSERSHNEPPAESPRTSIEEERGAIKCPSHGLDGPDRHTVKSRQERKEEPGSFEKGMPNEAVTSLNGDNTNSVSQKDDMRSSRHERDDVPSSKISGFEDGLLDSQSLAKEPSPVDRTSKYNIFSVDTTLLDQLFPPLQELDKQNEAPDDPIYSTTGRKAWYRLTRRQTLREYNSGSVNDDYIRVTWANSEIRKEVNKTVGRWAREDRLSGTGPGARVSFYWDTSAPAEPKVPLGHSRTKTSVPTLRAVISARQSFPPITTDAPAAFDWSSTAAADHWSLDSPALRSTSSPLAARSVISDHLGQENRVVSMKFASPDLGMREPVSNYPSETSGVAGLIAPPPITPAFPASPEQWNNFSSIVTNTKTKDDDNDDDDTAAAATAVEDDDEWGEMVGSPILAEPETSKTISQATTPSDITLALPATPPPSQYFSAQKQSAEAMHTSHITRLKGTISPTSAIFGARSFIPLGVEQGPIGPGILKPVKRPELHTLNRDPRKPLSAAPADVIAVHKSPGERADPLGGPCDETVVDIPHLEPAFAPAEDDDFSAFASAISAPPPAEPGTLQASAVSQQPVSDAWADADFSFFESAPPIPVPAQPKLGGSDAFSICETPTRSTWSLSTAPSKGYARSPPRTSPPPCQPLTGATNAAQRRKDEEEKTIRDILDRLPNLGYMLQ